MSYVYLPPRVANYFPPGPPYLAGLRGLGDYAADLAAYERDHAVWLQEKASYERSLSYYNGAIRTAQDNYARAKALYDTAKAQWDRDAAAYNSALLSYNAQVSAQRSANIQAVKALEAQKGSAFDQWVYDQGGCLTAAQKQFYTSNCQQVRGLDGGPGQSYGSAANCWYKRLPVCNFPTKPTLRSPPVAPVMAPPPAKPTLRAEPQRPVAPPPVKCWDGSSAPTSSACPPKQQCWNGTFVRDLASCPPKPTPPVTTTVPYPGNTPSSTTPLTPTPAEEDDSGKRGMIMNGLIIVAVATGGYLVHRTLKKPKAA